MNADDVRKISKEESEGVGCGIWFVFVLLSIQLILSVYSLTSRIDGLQKRIEVLEQKK